jgi:hypothetical protein
MSMRSRTPRATLGLTLTLLATAAHAEGPGIVAGDLVLHPEAFANGSFDNNVFYEDASEDPQSSSVLRVGAGVTLENRSPNKVALEAGANLSYRHYLASGEEFDARNTLDRAALNATAAFLPRAPITVELHEDLGFRDNPAFDDSEFGFRILDNSLGLDVRFRPGDNPDNRPFEMRLGYRWQAVNFVGDDADALNATVAEKDAHHVRFLTSWRFLPKTALLAEVGWSAIDYSDPLDVTVVGGGGQTSSVPADRDSRPLSVLIGVKGLVTRRVSTTLKVGYRNSFHNEGSSFSSVVGTAELTYAIEPTVRATLGYNRDGRDNAFSNFYTLNQAYGTADFYFLGRWSLGGRVGFDHYAFSEDAGGFVRAEGERTDPVLRGSVHAGFNPRDWMAVRLELASQQNLSEFENGTADDNENTIDPVAYSRQQVTLGLQINY